MRVKELKNIEEILNIKDDETFIYRLDYDITDYYERILDEEGFYIRTEYPYSIVKIFSQKLLDDINHNMELKFVLNEEIKVTKDIAQNIKEYIRNKASYTGVIGSRSI